MGAVRDVDKQEPIAVGISGLYESGNSIEKCTAERLRNQCQIHST